MTRKASYFGLVALLAMSNFVLEDVWDEESAYMELLAKEVRLHGPIISLFVLIITSRAPVCENVTKNAMPATTLPTPRQNPKILKKSSGSSVLSTASMLTPTSSKP